ncbi:phage terminase large subunit [Sphingomonas sp. A2-49]|uniref:phage terminase large subunit n=1 Tax=Sphingomonas sp. A2-49 TaxID=1391375 RepID=UPI0021CE6BED|nr:phage terminase large subunit [Sphingomonas sp. A2-49]MCU6455671.1 phage terminase large subunit [Sphingomonas sp. A2-49]
MRQRFDLFLMRVFGDLHSDKPPLHLAWYLRAICHASTEACATPGARLVINVPPRHLKSVAASVALTAWMLGRDPSCRIMVATYSQDLARLHATQCRTIMQTPWYRRIFPGTVIADDGNRMLEIVTTRGGGRKAVSVGGTVTGHGADVIIVDDCLKADDARSQAKRQEAKEWFDGTLATRLNTVGGGAIISISQRLHEDDLAAHLLDKGYDLLCLPAIAEREEEIALAPNVSHRRKVGDLLDRPGITREILDTERRNLGAQVYSSQFQQNPVAPEGNLVRMEWFGTYAEALERDRYLKVVQSWDTALSDQPGADYSVCTTWGYHERRWHLLDVLRQRLAFPDLKRAVLRLRRQWQADEIVIEDAGTGKALWQEFRASGELRPTMWSVTQDKEERLIGVTGQLEAGLCVLPADAPWLDAFFNELRAFPYGRHDDQVDSLTQFLEHHLRFAPWLMRERDARGRPVRAARPDRPQRRLRFG